MHRHHHLALAVAIPLALAPTMASGQELNRAFGTMTPPLVLAGACTGSTAGEGNDFAGGAPTEASFNVNHRLCDIKTANGPVSATSTFPNVAPQQLHAHASANYGVARVYAEQHVQNWQNQGLVFPRSVGQAGWVDQLVISAPGLDGQAGSFTGVVHIDGTFFAHGHQGFGGYNAAAYSSTTGNAPVNIFNFGGQNDPAIYVFDELRQVTLSFTYGTPFTVGVFARAFASNASEGGANHIPGDVLVDFDDSLVWQGLLSVNDAAGTPVTGYSIASTSGNPWVTGRVSAVPEPATVALTATGLALLGVLARRRTA